MSLEQQPQKLQLLRAPLSGAPQCHDCYQYARQGHLFGNLTLGLSVGFHGMPCMKCQYAVTCGPRPVTIDSELSQQEQEICWSNLLQ